MESEIKYAYCSKRWRKMEIIGRFQLAIKYTIYLLLTRKKVSKIFKAIS